MSRAELTGLAQRLGREPVDRTSYFALGDGVLRVRTSHREFSDRFELLFGDCEVDGADPGLPLVECCLQWQEDPPAGMVTFSDPDPPELFDFVRRVFPDRDVSTKPMPAPWRGMSVRLGAHVEQYAYDGDRLLILAGESWPSFIGSLAVARVLRIQRDRAFVHAGSVSVGGKGVVIAGPKESGKTTLSMALGARGHTVLGDEIAAIRLNELELVPFRRSFSVRPGPKSTPVRELLGALGPEEERYPDGQIRSRVAITDLFPGAATPVPWRAVVFLSGRASRASIEPVKASPENLRWMTLLGSSLWDMPPPVRAFRLMSGLSRVACYALKAGSIEDTTLLIEQSLGD